MCAVAAITCIGEKKGRGEQAGMLRGLEQTQRILANACANARRSFLEFWHGWLIDNANAVCWISPHSRNSRKRQTFDHYLCKSPPFTQGEDCINIVTQIWHR